MSATGGKGILALVSAALALGALVWMNVSIASKVIDISPRAPGSPHSIQTPPNAPVEDASRPEPELSQTLLRPIFSPTRTDFVPVSEPSEPPLEPAISEDTETAVLPAPLEFKGTRVLKGKFSALVSAGDGMAEWHEQGSVVGGWTIKSIFADRLFIIAGQHTEVLSLYGNDPPVPDESTQ